ncbi:NUDIX hydrolase, partial [Vibrio cholerae]|nr:NUDIX hydrolase [Vibrio cholerae]MVC06177.1 NUDIX hydrolase [Vibrio cholerae]MVC65794.1 NUDIX hydrolase [Vibrio cholerae]MVE41922.1 NUDIX hydrolase [Vibrio cholerae]MVF01637.1 NUDIX hydrolase [Vibrio cholerae]
MNHLAMAVVIKNNLVLVQKRFRKNTGMIFEFPGGSIDAGESGEQAAIRELWEETGLRNLKLIG